MGPLDLSGDYGPATEAHVAASASALEELCSVLTAKAATKGGRPIYVRLSHYEHGGFLTTLLFGFPALAVPGLMVEEPAVPYLYSQTRTAYVLRSADASAPEDPLTYAVVANHPVSTQIEHTIAMLAILLSRQSLVMDTRSGKAVTNIDVLASESDARAIQGINDLLRLQGWRAAAAAVAARATAMGRPLVVRYERPLFSPLELAKRAPVLRQVYNQIPAARTSIDKVATMLSQGLTVVGGGSTEMSAFARNLLDVGLSRTYLAHLARDAFVCGNGYLVFGSQPDEDVRLLQPEHVEILEPGVFRETAGDQQVIHRQVLHVPGAHQFGSFYGVSVLEPFIQIENQREVMTEVRDLGSAWDRPEVPEKEREDARSRIPLAQRQLAELEERSVSLLGGVKTIGITPEPGLYFRGMEQMSPHAERIAMLASDQASIQPASGTPT
jgi:hypothetical protein